MGFGDWTPLDMKPGADLPDAGPGEDMHHRRTAIAGLRNGMPDVLPYVWRSGEAQREAAFEARLAWIRRVAELRALEREAERSMAHGPTYSCPLCIEQYGPIRPPRPPGSKP